MMGISGYGAGDSDNIGGGMKAPNAGFWQQKIQAGPGYTNQQQYGDANLQELMKGYNALDEEGLRQGGGSFRANGYDITKGMGGNYYVNRAGTPGLGAEQHNGSYADIYDPTGKYLGSNKWEGLGGDGMDIWNKAIPLATMAMIGGGVAGGFGYGPFAGGGPAAPGLTGVDAAMADLASAGGLTPASFGAAGAGGGGFSLSSLFGGGGGGGLLSQLGSKAASAGLSSLFSGGGGSGGGLGSLGPWIGGAVDANRQGQAADKMLAWLNGNQAKMEGYMSPDSPEYKQLWEEMSRKDAAAGRNSQYGPRTADFMSRVAKEKADNTLRFTTGSSRAYADALNQNAAKYSGLLGAMGKSSMDLGSILNNIGGTWGQATVNDIINDSGDGWKASTMSNDELDAWINGGGFGHEYDIGDWWL